MLHLSDLDKSLHAHEFPQREAIIFFDKIIAHLKKLLIFAASYNAALTAAMTPHL